jgi:hypothetical protein
VSGSLEPREGLDMLASEIEPIVEEGRNIAL